MKGIDDTGQRPPELPSDPWMRLTHAQFESVDYAIRKRYGDRLTPELWREKANALAREVLVLTPK